MADVGTTYGTMKRAIVDALRARPALADVAVRYEAPAEPGSVTGPTGLFETIWFADEPADGDAGPKVVCGTPLQLDEEYDLPLVVQALSVDSDGTQEAADRRVDELAYEVVATLAADPTFGVTDFPRAEVLSFRWRRRTGQLPSGHGHGAGCQLDLHVEARLRFS